MNDLARYLELIVEPTVDDFKRNPLSVRHAFLACVATYHAIDRMTYPKPPGNLKREWRKNCPEFAIVDMVAHHFKHVKSDDEKARPRMGKISLSFVIFGNPGSNTDEQMELRNLFYVIQRAVKFLHQQATRKARAM